MQEREARIESTERQGRQVDSSMWEGWRAVVPHPQQHADVIVWWTWRTWPSVIASRDMLPSAPLPRPVLVAISPSCERLPITPTSTAAIIPK